jgi:hypothetical protein
MATIRQYLEAKTRGRHAHRMSPVLLGRGEPLLRSLDLRALGYECTKSIAGERATHLIIERKR